TNIAAKSPDVLFVPDYYSVVALVAQQAYAAGVKATMLGADGWDSVLGVVTDSSLLEGAYYCSGYSTEDTRPEVQTFVANFKAKYGADPDMFAAQGYDAAMILAAAIEKAEASGAKAGSDDYRQAVIDALKATDMDCVTGHVTFNEYNNPEKTAAIINITGGAAKYWGNY
ncbi:MAG: ABC transporter substrate-binding protein, partial [Clostridia bacterium]|nr:ABC transporter substrate-binding protein [Clostridia bacterium]